MDPTPPLAGLLVLDFTTLLPGPLATLMLAEAGAEVVKVERPGTGDELRTYEPRWGGDSANFALLNRGKRSIALDLKDPAQRTRLDPLLARADILVEQFRPGVMDRLGLGYPALAALNPRLIYCSVTGYGQTGPKCHVAGHDLNYIGDSGLLSLGHGPAEAPVVPPMLAADIAGGAYPAFMNILLALTGRAATGQGCHLDVAMAECVFPFLFWAMGTGQATGRWPGSGADLLSGGTPRYRLYPTQDGRILAVAAIEDRFWAVFCRVTGAKPGADAASVASLIASRPAADWRTVFAGQDCCCSIVATAQEALADPHFAARGLFARFVANAAGNTMTALPVPIMPAFRDAGTTRTSPALGEDNDALLGPG